MLKSSAFKKCLIIKIRLKHKTIHQISLHGCKYKQNYRTILNKIYFHISLLTKPR
jgi:hypothetical protein